MSNEITVKIKVSVEEFCRILEEKGFKVIEKYVMDDTYFIPKNLEIKNLSYREILSNAVILRNINETMPKRKVVKYTYKKKKFDKDGKILDQSKIECIIQDVKSGKDFLKALGYKELIKIKEKDIAYKKDGFEIVVKDIFDGDNLAEIEIVETNELYNTIEKLIKKVKELNIPIETDDFFIKKAEIELEKYYKRSI